MSRTGPRKIKTTADVSIFALVRWRGLSLPEWLAGPVQDQRIIVHAEKKPTRQHWGARRDRFLVDALVCDHKRIHVGLFDDDSHRLLMLFTWGMFPKFVERAIGRGLPTIGRRSILAPITFVQTGLVPDQIKTWRERSEAS